jgi:hypothetical protein
MTPRLKQRLPFALSTGLIILIGYRVADTSSVWQLALVGVAAIIAAAGPEIVGWLRARRSPDGDDTGRVAPRA